MTGYWTLKEASEQWNISERRINVLCSNGRILGVERAGRAWMIPEGTEKPKDARVKSGKYKKVIVTKNDLKCESMVNKF